MSENNLNNDDYFSLRNSYLDLLNKALEAFQELLNIQYNITVARKNNKYLLNLVVLERNFYHMAGLKYLSDVALAIETPNFYSSIVVGGDESENIKNQLVESRHFEKIVGRLYALIDLRDNFYNAKDNKHYKFVGKGYGNYTSIEYDYIIESEYKSTVYYYFLRYDEKSENSNQCVIVSLFTKGIADLTKGQARLTLLEKVEINKNTNKTTLIYRKG